MRRITVIMLLCIIIMILSLPLSACTNAGSDSESASADAKTFRWNREKSAFVGYLIEGDSVTLIYSLHFENATDDDMMISYPQAKFGYFEVFGWMQHTPISGYGEDGEKTFVVPADEAKDIVMMFTGTYLGGSVNEDLSLPALTFILDTVDPAY